MTLRLLTASTVGYLSDSWASCSLSFFKFFSQFSPLFLPSYLSVFSFPPRPSYPLSSA